ncbi:hypothetical protein PT300_00170 [Enterobacteriaceae bacterium ESL0689]|nr:hypothetical protein [Enterobacteriaceae bacterium ESL0689]
MIFFSAETRGFYFESLIDDYQRGSSFPADVVAVTEQEYEEYQSQPPDGLTIGSKDGRPAWIPETTDNSIVTG